MKQIQTEKRDRETMKRMLGNHGLVLDAADDLEAMEGLLRRCADALSCTPVNEGGRHCVVPELCDRCSLKVEVRIFLRIEQS